MVSTRSLIAIAASAAILVACDDADVDKAASPVPPVNAASLSEEQTTGTGKRSSNDAPALPMTSPAPPGAAGANGSPPTSVRIVLVEQAPLQSWIFGEGTARAVNREFLSFESAGRIAYVDPDLREGDRVMRGQMIAYQEKARVAAEIANSKAGIVDGRTQVAVAQASRMEAAANLKLAKKTFERFAVLLSQASASQQEYDEAAAQLEQARAAAIKADRQIAAAKAQVDAAAAQYGQAEVTERESELVSPIDGVIAHLNIRQGYYFSPQNLQTGSEQGALNTVPVVIIDPSGYEISVSIPARAFEQIERDAPALIETGSRLATPGTGRSPDAPSGLSRNPEDFAVRGTVYAVSPSFDPETRTFQVKIRTTNGASRLRDGEFVSVWIGQPGAGKAITIPRGAKRFGNGGTFVFVYDEKSSTVSRVDVEIGLQTDDREQVLSGLKPGMKVVTDGRSQLSDGDRVRIIEDAVR